MGDEVYADLLFLVNFSMDFLCFYFCARLLHRPLSLWRGVLASVLGGIYAVVALFFSVGRVPAFTIDAVVCFLLCVIALAGRQETLRALVRLWGLYLLISLLLGGIMTALFHQLNRIPGLTDRVSEDGLSTWVFFGIALLSSLLTFLWGRSFRRTTGRRRVRVIVEQDGKRVELEGICDSGNLLRDPLGGRPVIPADDRKLRSVVPAEVLRVANMRRGAEALTGLPPSLVSRIRLIPARGATDRQEKMLVGWQADHVYLCDAKGEHEVSVWLAPVSLSARDGVGALVPSEILW